MMKKFSLVFLSLILLGTIISYFKADSVTSGDLSNVLATASWQHLLGTDSLGRDLFWRILAGGQISIFVCLASSVGCLAIGFLVGALSAFSVKWLDQLIMRICEILIATPHVINLALSAILFQSLLGDSGLLVIALSLLVCGWMPPARFIRNIILKEKYKTYVEAAELMGVSVWRRMFVHILPNVKSSLITYWGLMLPQAILAEGVLSFLGLGVKSPMVSWGLLLQEGWKATSNYPHLLLAPGIILTLTVFSINWLLEDWRKSLRISYSHREAN